MVSNADQELLETCLVVVFLDDLGLDQALLKLNVKVDGGVCFLSPWLRVMGSQSAGRGLWRSVLPALVVGLHAQDSTSVVQPLNPTFGLLLIGIIREVLHKYQIKL